VNLRLIPWLVAVVGLGTLLVASGFRVWVLVAVWLAALAVVWVWGHGVRTTRAWRIAASLVLLPILFLLAFEGGWWLIPADLAWLAIELIDRRGAETTA
jgi:hypothetical protein